MASHPRSHAPRKPQPEPSEQDRERQRLEAELRLALARGELCLRYQPQLDGVSGALLGAEALLRWRHERRGLVRAAEFVPIVEEMELVEPLGEFVLATACRQLGEWQREGVRLGRVSVNVAARQLLQPGFVASVRDALAANGLAAGALGVEITERVLADGCEEVTGPLQALRQLGVEVALDDFGSGRSRLSALAEMPIDVIKLDRSLVRGLPEDQGAVAISRMVCSLADRLGLRVVGEGVETPEQARTLWECGADALQGYHISPALAPAELVDFVVSHADAAAVSGAFVSGAPLERPDGPWSAWGSPLLGLGSPS